MTDQRVRRICQHCGAEFSVWRKVVQAGFGKYCSRPCAWANRRILAMARFWEHVDRSAGPNGCWPWLAGKDHEGYGTSYGSRRAHRVAYEEARGPIPDGLVIDHLCGNPSCVNPAHMEAVTNRINVLRGKSPSAMRARDSHCKHGHPFDSANTRFIVTPSGHRGRVCRECGRADNRARRAAKKAAALAA